MLQLDFWEQVINCRISALLKHIVKHLWCQCCRKKWKYNDPLPSCVASHAISLAMHCPALPTRPGVIQRAASWTSHGPGSYPLADQEFQHVVSPALPGKHGRAISFRRYAERRPKQDAFRCRSLCQCFAWGQSLPQRLLRLNCSGWLVAKASQHLSTSSSARISTAGRLKAFAFIAATLLYIILLILENPEALDYLEFLMLPYPELKTCSTPRHETNTMWPMSSWHLQGIGGGGHCRGSSMSRLEESVRIASVGQWGVQMTMDPNRIEQNLLILP